MFGATYYVRTDGNDSNSGTSNTSSGAWRTIAKAASTLVAGDTVNVAAGSYSGAVTESTSGTAASPITYNLAPGVVVVGNISLSGNYITWTGGTCSPASAGGYNAVSLGGSYLTVNSVEVTAYGAKASDQATAIGISGSNIQLNDAHIHDMNDIDAFHIWGQNNTIRRAKVHGIVQANYAQNHTDEFQTWGNGSPSINIYFVDCTFYSNDCQFGNNETDGYSNLHDWYFINCVWKDISGTFFCGVPKTKFYNCVFDNVSGNPLNNVITFYGINNYSSVGSEVKNCVFYRCKGGIGFNGASQSDITATHNYIGTSSFGTQSSWVGSSAVNGGDPRFANPTAMDYHIGSGSVLIGAGENLSAVFTTDRDDNTRPASGTWDIGAYQYGSSSVASPVVSVSPTTLNFGAVASGLTVTNSFTVKNAGSGTLAGTATVAAPFAIVSGGTYSLGSGQSQTVSVAYTPSGAAADTKTVTFTGGGGATATVSGSLLASTSPSPTDGTVITAGSGSIAAPFVLANGYVYQTTLTSDPTAGGRAAYSFTVTNQGVYVIQALVNAASDGANSLFVNIDAEPQTPTMVWDIPVTSGFEQRIVSWRGNGTDVSNQFVPKSFTLSPGQHQIIIRGREPQTQLASLTILRLPATPANFRFVQSH